MVEKYDQIPDGFNAKVLADRIECRIVELNLIIIPTPAIEPVREAILGTILEYVALLLPDPPEKVPEI